MTQAEIASMVERLRNQASDEDSAALEAEAAAMLEALGRQLNASGGVDAERAAEEITSEVRRDTGYWLAGNWDKTIAAIIRKHVRQPHPAGPLSEREITNIIRANTGVSTYNNGGALYVAGADIAARAIIDRLGGKEGR